MDVSSLGSTEWKDLDFGKLLVFASVATIIENSMMWPFWALKTRQQVETGALSHGKHFDVRGIRGIRKLYRGFCFYAVASLPAYLTYVTAYTWAKDFLGFSYDDDIIAGTSSSSGGSFMAPMLAGIIADAACLGLYVPVEIVAQRLQLPTRYSGVRHVVKDMWRENGWKTFYRGFGATVVTSAVTSGVWWQSYESLKKGFTLFLGAPDPSQLDPSVGFSMSLGDISSAIRQSLPHMAAGFIAGATSALVTNPLDVVKTRLQTDRVKPAPLSFFRNLRVVMQKEGLRRSFFRGLVPKIVSTAPLGILSSIMYEGFLFLSRKEGPKQVS